MKRDAAIIVWLAVGAVLALAFGWGTFFISAWKSCPPDGPNPGAQAEYCGWQGAEPTDYSELFIWVHILPSIPILVGSVLVVLGRSKLFVVGGVLVALLVTSLIWWLEP